MGTEIRRRRTALRMTVVELARRADITPNYLGDLESGRRRRNPSVGTVMALARCLGAELSELLGGRRVDLRTAEDLSRYFRDEVVRTAVVQYARG